MTQRQADDNRPYQRDRRLHLERFGGGDGGAARARGHVFGQRACRRYARVREFRKFKGAIARLNVVVKRVRRMCVI